MATCPAPKGSSHQLQLDGKWGSSTLHQSLVPFHILRELELSINAALNTCLHSSCCPWAHAHLERQKKPQRNSAMEKMPLTWVTEWDTEEKPVMWRQGERRYSKELCNEQKTNPNQSNHTHRGSCLPRGTPQIRTTHESSAICQYSCNLQGQDTQACWDLLEEIPSPVVNINHVLMHLHLSISKAAHGITTRHSPVSFLVG